MLPYLLPNECRPRLEGLKTDWLTDDDLVLMSEDVMSVIDGYLGYSLQCDEHDELQTFAGENFSFDTYHTPIRRVTTLEIVTYVEPDSNGVPQMKGYPLKTQNILIDRFKGTIQASDLAMQLQVIPFVSFIIPQIHIVYTAGYDDGILENSPDGVLLPYPRWLKSAARACMAKLASEYNNYRRNLIGLGSVSIGGISYSMMREQNARTREVSWLPKRAIDILEGNIGFHVWVGQ